MKMMMMTLLTMTTDDWIKIGVSWGFVALVAIMMITTFLIDRRISVDREKNLKKEVTVADENQLESSEARDRRMKELYEKVWGPERKKEELERKIKKQIDN